MAPARYAIRIEASDGTLEDAIQLLSNKRLALHCARQLAKSKPSDVARVFVDDTKTDLSVAWFKVVK